MDYFGPLNQALRDSTEHSNNSLAQAYKLHEFESKQKLAKLQYDAAKLAHDTTKREMDIMNAARDKAQAAPEMVQNPAYAQWNAEQMGPPQMPQPYAGLEQQVQANPGFAKLSGADRRLANMQAAQPVYPGGNQPAPPQMLPNDKAALYIGEIARQDPMLAAKAWQQFASQVPAGVDPQEMVQRFNQATGLNLAYTGKNDWVVNKDPKTGAMYAFSAAKFAKNPQEGFVSLTEGVDLEAQADKKHEQRLKEIQAQGDVALNRALAVADRRAAAGGGADKTDPIVAREAVKDLGAMRTAARQAESSKARIATMMPLIERGAAGGLKGNALASISGVFDVTATSEADLFKRLASAGAGALRTQVVGPGPVSNYENQLLQSISGGGNGARSAVIQLLKFYGKEADRTIQNYNDAIDSTAEVAPSARRAFKPITGGVPKQSAPTGPKVGEVVDGYKFKGGNPADQKNWIKVGR